MKQKILCGLLALLLVVGMAGICSYALDENIRTFYTAIPNSEEQDSFENIEVSVNDEKVIFDQLPKIVDGRIFVPIIEISEALDVQIEWDIMTQCVTFTRGNDNIVMAVDKNTYIKNGKILTLDIAPQIIDGVTLVPVRMIAEAFGCHVEWDETSKKVVIED